MIEGCRPEAALFLNANDGVEHLGRMVADTRRMRTAFDVFAVVHRGTETFTHVYLVPRDAVRARRDVRLAAVFAGEALHEARRWAATRYGPALCADLPTRLAA